MIQYLAWPGAVLILGLVGMFTFKSSIARLVDRTRKIGKTGIETLEPPQLPAPAPKPDALAEFMAAYDNALLREVETSILEDLQKRGLTDQVAAQKALVRSLAGTQILLHFEMANAAIWASQIAALTYLNSRPGYVSLGEIQPFYEDARAKFPILYHDYGLSGWALFLESWRLATRQFDTVAISVAGREFLKWRIEAGRAGPFHG